MEITGGFERNRQSFVFPPIFNLGYHPYSGCGVRRSRKKVRCSPLDKLDLIVYIYNTNIGGIYGTKAYTQRQAIGNQNGLTNLREEDKMKLIVFIVLVALAIIFPPITVLYTIVGLIYLVKAVA